MLFISCLYPPFGFKSLTAVPTCTWAPVPWELTGGGGIIQLPLSCVAFGSKFVALGFVHPNICWVWLSSISLIITSSSFSSIGRASSDPDSLPSSKSGLPKSSPSKLSCIKSKSNTDPGSFFDEGF